MKQCHVFHNRQSKPRPAEFAAPRLINTVETFKNPFLMLFRNPDSMIKHVNAEQVAAAPFHRNFDFGIFIAVFDRVVDQVDDRLLQKLGVGMNHHSARGRQSSTASRTAPSTEISGISSEELKRLCSRFERLRIS